MDFSFFRKKPPPQPVKTRSKAEQTEEAKKPQQSKPGAPAVAHAASEEITPVGTGTDGGAAIAEASAETCSVIEEAAIFYANDRNTQAITTLAQYLQEHPTQPDLQPWLMLFDLYQSQGMRQEFDKLALEFVVRFERSSPIWVDTTIQQDASPKPVQTGGGDYVGLSGQVNAASVEPKLKRLRDFAQQKAVRLDFSKLESIDQSGCEAVLATLIELKATGKKVRCIHTESIIKQLKQEVAAPPDPAHHPCWLLLFYFYQVSGLQAEFEDLAVEYAVAFEVSPPSWEEVTIQAAPDPAMETMSAPPEEDEDVFQLSGVIATGISDNQMADLMKFAEDKTEVNIDMSRTSRVDFMSVGNVLTLLMQLSQSGKKITIKGANEMILGLFSAMGINQFATLVRKTK